MTNSTATVSSMSQPTSTASTQRHPQMNENNSQQTHRHSGNNFFKSKPMNVVEMLNNNRLDEPNNNVHDSRLSMVANSISDLSDEQMETRRHSVVAQLFSDERRRKKNLDNLLESHIETLRRSSANNHFGDI